MKKRAFNSFENRIYRLLKISLPKGSRLLVAVSGGVDSVVLLQVLRRLRPLLKFADLAVAHVHHGVNAEPKLRRYRRQTQNFVRELAAEDSFFTNEVANSSVVAAGASEGELRQWRREHLAQWAESFAATHIVFAHHEDDLLETRLIRLMRGTGPQGLQSMRVLQEKGLGPFSLLRPLLAESREEIEHYAKLEGLHWVEDPSNSSDQALRNWLRRKWLPQLEKKRPGSRKAFARSLEQISTQWEKQDLSREDSEERLRLLRAKWPGLSYDDKQRKLAAFLRAREISSYGKSHIQELVKRLDNPRKRFTFDLLKHRWVLTEKWISVEKL